MRLALALAFLGLAAPALAQGYGLAPPIGLQGTGTCRNLAVREPGGTMVPIGCVNLTSKMFEIPLSNVAGAGNAAGRNVGTTAGTVAAGDDGRFAAAAQKASNLSDLANPATARTNLGLGTAATSNATDFLTTAAGGTAGGTITAPTFALASGGGNGITLGVSQAYLSATATQVVLNGDANNYLSYNRSSPTWTLAVAGANAFTADATRMTVAKPMRVSGGTIEVSAASGSAISQLYTAAAPTDKKYSRFYQATNGTTIGDFVNDAYTGSRDWINVVPNGMSADPYINLKGEAAVNGKTVHHDGNSGRCKDVRRYGAKFDGTTDDTAAVQAAIDAVTTGNSNKGGCIELPDGNTVLGTINLREFSEGLQIQGAGTGLTKIRPLSGELFKKNATTIQSRNLQIRGMSIIPTAKQTAGSWIDLYSVFGVRIHDIYAEKGWNFLDGNAIGLFDVCGTHLRTFGGTVFTLRGGGDEYRWCDVNNYDDDDLGDGQATYLLVRNNNGIYIGNVDAIHCGNCFVFNPIDPGAQITWVFLNHTMADTGSGTGYRFDAAAGTTIKGVQGVGIWSASFGSHGLYIGGAGTLDGFQFIGPRLQNNGQWGAVLNQGTNIYISNPMITGNDQTNTTTGGLFIAGGTGKVKVMGGLIGTSTGYGNTQQANIVIGSGGSGRSLSILGVDLCGTRSGGSIIFDDMGSAGVRYIRDNACFNAPD